MIDKKTLLARCLVAGRVLSPISRIRAACRADIPILTYHRVWDVDDEDKFQFDIELISASTADFRWQMEYVRQNFDPITCGTLLQILDGDTPSPPRPIIITFDDGFDDNFQNAFPILNVSDVPATMFLSTGYIGGEKTFWYDRLAQLILQAPAHNLTIKGLAGPVQLKGNTAFRRKVLRSVVSEMKTMPNAQRLSVLSSSRAARTWPDPTKRYCLL